MKVLNPGRKPNDAIERNSVLEYLLDEFPRDDSAETVEEVWRIMQTLSDEQIAAFYAIYSPFNESVSVDPDRPGYIRYVNTDEAPYVLTYDPAST